MRKMKTRMMNSLIPQPEDCPRCTSLKKALKAATLGPQGKAGVGNYSVVVYDYPSSYTEIQYDLSRDAAFGYAEGCQEYYDDSRGGRQFLVVCGDFVCYPEDRYGEILENITRY